MNQADWIWMPHPGHLIVASDCRFHLCTCVGDFLVSTVGEWLPSEGAREILARSRGIVLEGKGDAREADYLQKLGFEQIGAGRKYETMVFKARRGGQEGDCPCCPWLMADASELDARGYNDPEEARLGHLALCAKWAAGDPPKEPPP